MMNNETSNHNSEGPQQREAASKDALNRIERIFSQWTSLSERLTNAAVVFRIIGSRIDWNNLAIDVSGDVIIRFETVCLWLRKTLPQLAPEVQEQASKLLDGSHVEEIIIALHSLSEHNRRKLRLRYQSPLLASLRSGFGLFPMRLDYSIFYLLDPGNLQSLSVTLIRIASILEYAASDLEQIEDIDDIVYRNHYDPTRVDRSRVLQLLMHLEQQVSELPENAVKKQLASNVKELIAEVHRPRPRWRSFIGKAVILLAIIADIKTMHPEIGNDILRTIDAVIQAVVTGSQVTHATNSKEHGQRA